MELDGLAPQVLPASISRLDGGVPPAPPGLIFVLGSEGGYAVPRMTFTLLFGRDRDDVHVPVGPADPYVSRVHGRIVGDGRDWWVHNDGNLPIQNGETLILQGNSMLLSPGYTPLFIKSSQGRSHLLEVHIAGARPQGGPEGPVKSMETVQPETYDLTVVERAAVAALAQRYLLGHEKHPQPVSWQQVAEDLNRAMPEQAWTKKRVEHMVARIRERLASDPHRPVSGLRREEGIGEPVGNILNHNLIQALLLSGSLSVADLDLLNLPG